jgi:hypothetical protein
MDITTDLDSMDEAIFRDSLTGVCFQ